MKKLSASFRTRAFRAGGYSVLAGVIVLIIGAAAAAFLMPKTVADEDMVVISVDGQEYTRVPLSRPHSVTVKQSDGRENIIEISDHGAVMAYSSCDNQLCVHMGEVTVDNWEFRPNQQFIICLPNRVSVELVVKE